MFSTADVVARRARGIDLRNEGSGNPGAANALGVLGPRAGLAVLGGDLAKGVVASGLGGLLAGPVGARFAGTAAVIGHCHPANQGFRGGKGVATSAGQCLATFPAYFPIDVAVAAATAAVPVWKQRAFTATVVSSACWVVGSTVWWIGGRPNAWGGRAGMSLPLSALLSSVVILERFVAAGDRPDGTGAQSRSAVEADAEAEDVERVGV